MNTTPRMQPITDRNWVSLLSGSLAAAAVIALASSPAGAAPAPGGSGPAGANAPVKLEAIPGSPVKRITLTPKAAERLGIMTGKVSMERVVRKQMVSGLVIPPVQQMPETRPSGGFGGFGALQPTASPTAEAQAGPLKATAGEAWVLVSVSKLEWDRLAKDKPARLFPLATRDPLVKEVAARPSGRPPVEDMRRSMLTLYYVVPGADHGLQLNTRMRVELPLDGNDEQKKVVPYSAIYYDAKGAPWVYVSSAPLVFERKPVSVERIEGDVAVLSDGPDVGTSIVTTGAAMLFGTEIFGK